MENNFLPIGSIITLKKTKKKVMIIGFLCKEQDKDSNLYDYIGCAYPEGVISSDINLLFNNDDIDSIICDGYIDNEEKLFKEKLNKLIETIKK